MKKYLVLLESGKNKIANMDIHIQKYSIIVNAESFEDAENKAYININGVSHYGHTPDYLIVYDIKNL